MDERSGHILRVTPNEEGNVIDKGDLGDLWVVVAMSKMRPAVKGGIDGVEGVNDLEEEDQIVREGAA